MVIQTNIKKLTNEYKNKRNISSTIRHSVSFRRKQKSNSVAVRAVNPDRKKSNDQTCSCPRGRRVSAIEAPLEPLGPSQSTPSH